MTEKMQNCVRDTMQKKIEEYCAFAETALNLLQTGLADSLKEVYNILDSRK